MEAVYTHLTERARTLLILIAGPPGSGKSTIADEVAARLNKIFPPDLCASSTGTTQDSIAPAPTAIVVRMDGYHYTRAHLSTFPNADEAHARRGAAWTFDAEGVLALFHRLRKSMDTEFDSHSVDISIPTFDHAAKDPVADGDVVRADTPLVILEGNWLLYDQDPWRRLSELVDESWFVDVEAETARRRIAHRHLQSGIESTLEAALARTDSNDIPNGEDVRRKLIVPTVKVWSVNGKQ